jgi:hypothetical protein
MESNARGKRQINKQNKETNKQTNKRTNERTNEQINKRTNNQTTNKDKQTKADSVQCFKFKQHNWLRIAHHFSSNPKRRTTKFSNGFDEIKNMVKITDYQKQKNKNCQT